MPKSRLRTSLETNAQLSQSNLSQSNLQVWKVTTLLIIFICFINVSDHDMPKSIFSIEGHKWPGVILITVPCVLLGIKNVFVCLLVPNTWFFLFVDWTCCWRCERDGGAVPSIESKVAGQHTLPTASLTTEISDSVIILDSELDTYQQSNSTVHLLKLVQELSFYVDGLTFTNMDYNW